VKFGPSYFEYVGQTSGANVVYSGGIATGYNAVPNTITVNDVNSFRVDGFVYIDANADGKFETNLDDGNGGNGPEINETLPNCITAINSSAGTITLARNTVDLDVNNFGSYCSNLTTLNILGTETTGGRMSGVTVTSSDVFVQETEPIITGMQVGSGNQVSENEMGTFKIENKGSRSLTANKIRF
jgi:hypothetical protein